MARQGARSNALIDLPFAVSPVVIGLSLVLVYGVHGWLGGALTNAGIQVIFSLPGMVLATIFVSLPFVVREVTPVLREIGNDQEQAAATLGAGGWQTFWRVTLPSIRWGVAYGVVLTRRALHRRVRRGQRRLRARSPARPRRSRCSSSKRFIELRPRGRLRRLRAAGADRARDAARDDHDQAATEEEDT